MFEIKIQQSDTGKVLGSPKAMATNDNFETDFTRRFTITSTIVPPALFIIALRDVYLYDEIFLHCTPGSIFNVGKTCRTGQSAAQDFVRREFNINKHLRRFFPDPLSFRSLQARSGAVISGSNALQFLNRSIYPESDMDLYVTVESALSVCTYLMSKQGGSYTLRPRASELPIFETTWEDIFPNQVGLTATENFGRAWYEFVTNWAPRSSRGMVISPHTEPATGYGAHWVLAVFSFISHVSGEERTVQIIVTMHDPISSILMFHSCEYSIISSSFIIK